jgi:hypothetical protein
MKSFDQFRSEFDKIKSEGFIKSMRNGNTGAGYTLETKFGLIENNTSLPDLRDFLTELKTKRIKSKSSSMLTLLTDENGWQLEQIDFIEQNGWNHSKHEGEKTAQSSIRTKINKRGFYLDVNDPNYLLVCKNGSAFIKWEWQPLCDRFISKCKNLIVVDYAFKKQEDADYFHFQSFNHYQNFSTDAFLNAIRSKKICVELRLYTQYNLNKGVRNRGTAFRISPSNVHLLYATQEYYS